MTSSSTIRTRIDLLRLLRHAGAGAATALVTVRVLQALLPAAGAVATGWLLAELGTDPLAPLLALTGVLLAGQALTIGGRWLTLLVTSRIDGAHRSAAARLATGTDTVETLERQETQALLKAAAADPTEWVEKTPGQGACAALRILSRYVGLIGSAAVVAAWSPWLLPVLVVPAILIRHLTFRMLVHHYGVWVDGLDHHRRHQYWNELSSDRAAAKEIRVFGLTEWITGHYERHMRRHLEPVWKNNTAMAVAEWKRLAIAVAPLAAAFCAVAYTAAGSREIGLASAALTAAWGVFSAIADTDDMLETEGARPGVAALAELRRILPAGAGGAVAARPAAPPPLIRFEDVEFAYPGRAPVIKGLSLDVRPGETLAVVGFNGTGKSTLIKLLAGAYRPTAGRVSADGADIAAMGQGEWRSHLAVVYQDFVKYHLTAAENIALGRPGPLDEEALRRALADSGFGPVADRLGRGLDTPMDRSREGGVDLSGGQWQQLALARALYAVAQGASVLVLDEPTAHLDVRTERDLFARLEAIDADITTVLVSHRLTTVRRADRIVLLDEGRVAEAGTHAELMALGGVYAKMYAVQSDRIDRAFDDRLEEGELL